MVPHDVHNAGAEPVRVVGFFGNAAVVHRFFEPFLPGAAEAVFVHGPEGEEALAAAPVGVPVA